MIIQHIKLIERYSEVLNLLHLRLRNRLLQVNYLHIYWHI